MSSFLDKLLKFPYWTFQAAIGSTQTSLTLNSFKKGTNLWRDDPKHLIGARYALPATNRWSLATSG
jgi:hypothetical protein